MLAKEPARPDAGQPWLHAGGVLSLDPCRVMAVVNVTPDSFSDGGRFLSAAAEAIGPDAAAVAQVVAQCRRWIEQGAAILDVGGESTRPGAAPVAVAVELARVLPVIAGLRADPVCAAAAISVDTRRAAVARAALVAGATIVNDVSGLADPEMAAVAAAAGAGLVIGHLRGEPATMQQQIHFDDLLAEVGDELAAAVARAEAAGVDRRSILVDPGLGFGKTALQSAALLAASAALHARTGCPVLIGASRKRFLAAVGAAGEAAGERTLASVAAAVLAADHGAAVLRVHDVAETVAALRLQAAVAAEWAAIGPGRGAR